MAIRMSGLVSGMDTESVVEQLMEAHKLKKTKVENNKTKLEWKQEKWKELNTKLYKLYTDQVSKMRLQSTYKTKKVSSSNESAITATASSSAPAGSNIVSVNKLASSQYVTGADISAKGLTKNSKLADAGIAAGTVITVKVGTGDDATTKNITVDSSTTINDFVTALKDSGLNANFDEKQGRFFISSVDSGEENAFTITSSALTTEAVDGRNAIRDAIGYDNLSATDKKTVDNAFTKIATGTYAEVYEATNSLLDIVEKNTRSQTKTLATDYVKSVAKESVLNDTDTMDKIRTDAQDAVSDESVASSIKEQYTKDAKAAIEQQLEEDIANGTVTLVDDSQKAIILKERMDANLDNMVQAKLDDTEAYEADIAAKKEEMVQAKVDAAVNSKVAEKMNSDECKAQVEYLTKNGLSDDSLAAAVSEGVFSEAEAGYVAITDDNKFASADEMVTIARDNLQSKIEAYQGMSETSGTTSALSQIGLGEITGSEVTDTTGTGMTVISAKDSEITLNGAVLKGTSNTFSVNGMTFDLKSVTEGQTVTLNVTNDVEAVYDSVKEFVTKYNEILKEMNELYDADSARGYEPLTDDEREAMTEEQVEKWEKKIKDSLVRRDSTLGTLINSMRTAMSSSVEVDGSRYSLATYGITTSSDYTEMGLLHIYGDEDDSTYSSMTDKLKAALTEDPDAVIETLTGVAQKLFDAMADKMKGSSVSSAQTFYNDKHISNQLKEYTSSISKWEDKLKDIEDKYYKQFSAMETALQKLNSQSSYLTGLFSSGQ